MPSQLGQDRWVLERLETPGYFLELGAYHPVDLSNTHALEQRGWRGVSVDPFPAGDWAGSRPATRLVEAVVTGDGRDVCFVKAAELGGIQDHIEHHAHQVRDKPVVALPSITPSELVDIYGVPDHVQYMSLDTEGSELEILRAFPFDRVRVDLITVEHNFEEPKRTEIRALLESRGYRLDTAMRWDDWYVLADES